MFSLTCLLRSLSHDGGPKTTSTVINSGDNEHFHQLRRRRALSSTLATKRTVIISDESTKLWLYSLWSLSHDGGTKAMKSKSTPTTTSTIINSDEITKLWFSNAISVWFQSLEFWDSNMRFQSSMIIVWELISLFWCINWTDRTKQFRIHFEQYKS